MLDFMSIEAAMLDQSQKELLERASGFESRLSGGEREPLGLAELMLHPEWCPGAASCCAILAAFSVWSLGEVAHQSWQSPGRLRGRRGEEGGGNHGGFGSWSL